MLQMQQGKKYLALIGKLISELDWQENLTD